MPLALIASLPFAFAPELPSTQERETPPGSSKPAWEFSLSAFYVDPPGGGSHATTVLYADRDQLHLEARYNYEDLDTASLFAGWTFEVGSDVHAALTPMLGGVVGETNGVAPGLRIDADWRKLNFYSESEYLFDDADDDADYFYSWSTLMWNFTDAFALGIVTERSRIVETDLQLQRGLAVQVSPGPVGFALYAYNLGSEDEYYTLSLEVGI